LNIITADRPAPPSPPIANRPAPVRRLPVHSAYALPSASPAAATPRSTHHPKAHLTNRATWHRSLHVRTKTWNHKYPPAPKISIMEGAKRRLERTHRRSPPLRTQACAWRGSCVAVLEIRGVEGGVGLVELRRRDRRPVEDAAANFLCQRLTRGARSRCALPPRRPPPPLSSATMRVTRPFSLRLLGIEDAAFQQGSPAPRCAPPRRSAPRSPDSHGDADAVWIGTRSAAGAADPDVAEHWRAQAAADAEALDEVPTVDDGTSGGRMRVTYSCMRRPYAAPGGGAALGPRTRRCRRGAKARSPAPQHDRAHGMVGLERREGVVEPRRTWP